MKQVEWDLAWGMLHRRRVPGLLDVPCGETVENPGASSGEHKPQGEGERGELGRSWSRQARPTTPCGPAVDFISGTTMSPWRGAQGVVGAHLYLPIWRGWRQGDQRALLGSSRREGVVTRSRLCRGLGDGCPDPRCLFDGSQDLPLIRE